MPNRIVDVVDALNAGVTSGEDFFVTVMDDGGGTGTRARDNWESLPPFCYSRDRLAFIIRRFEADRCLLDGRLPMKTVRGMFATSEHLDLDGDKARLAQHLWMNGAGIKAIAARIHSRPSGVQAYLASPAVLPNEQHRGPIHASLKDTVLEALPCQRNYLVSVRLYHHPSSQVTIDIDVFGLRGQHARLRRTERDYFILQSPVGLINVLEAADRAAATWYETMRPQFRVLGIEIASVCTPQEKPCRKAGPKRIDLRPLAQPLLELLDRCWKRPRKKYEGYEQLLTVTLEANPVVSYRSGSRAKPRPLKGKIPQVVTSIARSIHRAFENALVSKLIIDVTNHQFEVRL